MAAKIPNAVQRESFLLEVARRLQVSRGVLEEELRKKVRDKKERHRMVCERALAAFDGWWSEMRHTGAELQI